MTAQGGLLLDTNNLVHILRVTPLGQKILSEHKLLERRMRPLISAITAGELLAFAKRNGWGEVRQQRLRELLGQLFFVNVEQVLERYADIDTWCIQNGRALGQNDRWIAATAATTGALLLTTDKNFDPLNGLFLQRVWYDPSVAPVTGD